MTIAQTVILNTPSAAITTTLYECVCDWSEAMDYRDYVRQHAPAIYDALMTAKNMGTWYEIVSLLANRVGPESVTYAAKIAELKGTTSCGN